MTYPTYKLFKNIDGVDVCVIKEKNGIIMSIPFDVDNIDYQQYLEDLKTHGMSIVSCDDCGDGVPNDLMPYGGPSCNVNVFPELCEPNSKSILLFAQKLILILN